MKRSDNPQMEYNRFVLKKIVGLFLLYPNNAMLN